MVTGKTQRTAARTRALPVFALAVLALGACGRTTEQQTRTSGPPAPLGPFYAEVAKMKASPAAVRELGRTMFADPSLSASGRQACAGCHDPARAYGPANDLSAQSGGVNMDRVGTRAVPSLRYVYKVPPFTEHFFEADNNDSEDKGPTGGHTWDGRAPSLHEQAVIPLTAPHEMANKDTDAVVARIRSAPYADTFRKTFGADIFDDPRRAFIAAQMALETFQQTPEEFYPYSSKYDAFLRGEARLTPGESRGLDLFNNPDKGNCASCHPSAPTPEGGRPLFTDWGFIALGVPRNGKLPANADPDFFDLGLCGPDRTDLKDKAEYCGLFRVPSLRNVAVRRVFFHNGVVHSLTDAVRFYAQRDTHPEKWYPRGADGRVRKFDDLPARYRGNVETGAPFGRRPGGHPALTESEIRDVVAFLGTLTDGYEAPTRQAGTGKHSGTPPVIPANAGIQ